MDLLDSTIVNIGIPSIQANLGASYAAIQWLIAGYALSFALLLVTGGRMGDVFGYKKLFMFGVAGFTAASLFSGLAWDPNILILARLLQGAMAALMVPQVMALMQVMYKPHERGVVSGLFGALGGLSASLGPVVGGLLIQANFFNLDWRPIFLINVPIGIIGLILAARFLPEGKSPHPLKLDIVGTVILMVAMTLLVFPLIEGRDMSWPIWTYVMMILSIPAFIVFGWWQKRKMARDGSPLVPPPLFKKRSFTAGLIMNLVFQSAMIGFFLTFGLYLQIGLGFSPLQAALCGLPTAVGIGMTMTFFGKSVIPKLGRRALFIGPVLMGTGLLITTLVMQATGVTAHGWEFIPGLLLTGSGMGFVFGALFAAVLTDVDAHSAGSASGTLNAVQQVGGAIGVALIGVIFFGQLTSQAGTSFTSIEPQFKASLTQSNVPAPIQAALISKVKTCFIDRSAEKDANIIPPSCQQAQMPPDAAALTKVVTDTAVKANGANFANAFKWGVIYEVSMLVLTVILAFLLPRRFSAKAYEEL
jgi:EmrB/QacA subfamily drug resistance transporter